MATPTEGRFLDDLAPPPEAWAYAKHTRAPVMIRSRRPEPAPIIDKAFDAGDWCFAAGLAIVLVGWLVMVACVAHHFFPRLLGLMRPTALPKSMFATRKPPRAGRPSWKVAEEYKRWLRKLVCSRCAQDPGDPANPIVAAHVDIAGEKGVGTKVADKHCLPLCDRCHQEQHGIGWLSFEKLLPLGDAVALASIYWIEWPGSMAWEREQARLAEARA